MLTNFFADRVIKYGVYIGSTLIFLGFILVGIVVFKLPPLIPLFYNRAWGQDQLSNPIGLFYLLGGALLIFISNSFFAKQYCSEKALLARILVWIGVLCILLALITIIKIIVITI